MAVAASECLPLQETAAPDCSGGQMQYSNISAIETAGAAAEAASHANGSAAARSASWGAEDAVPLILQDDQAAAAAAANGAVTIGRYTALLSAASAALDQEALQQLAWLDERRTDRPVVPPSQDPYRDGSFFTECLHLETTLFALLRAAGSENPPPPDLTPNILHLNRLLLDAKRQLDAGRYRLLKQMRLLLAQSNSPFNNFYQLRRGYRLLNMLGRGGFAEVWEVFDPLTCSVAAAKLHVLSAVKKERERLKIVRRVQNEIEIHKDIRPHPFIVEMKACFEMGNDVLASILQFCEGEMGREHVKGELASTEKQEQRLELLEVVPADEKIDIWAVGCILFEMLFNKRPFNRVPHQVSADPSEHIIAEAKKGLVIPKGPRKISDGAEVGDDRLQHPPWRH
ncbi:tyrosine kinase-like protein [Cyclospora cayetanensis]|uniref:Tyrosine kinase-like protein n=1 Tax=Cyclospora cayetanensis TaxID=88456 RepID=A0A1D3D354_9EIME|nr:tyrosine kinase-like protein [Cyclospora cayetanensis]